MNNKQEIQAKIDSLKSEINKLQEILNKPEQVSKEQRFLELSNNLVRKYDFEKNPQVVNYFTQDGLFMFQQDFKNQNLWCSYDRIWSVFEKEYGMNYEQIKDFIKEMVEKHFKWTGLTPVKASNF